MFTEAIEKMNSKILIPSWFWSFIMKDRSITKIIYWTVEKKCLYVCTTICIHNYSTYIFFCSFEKKLPRRWELLVWIWIFFSSNAYYDAQWAKIEEKVQFTKAAIFTSKAKVNVFWHSFFESSGYFKSFVEWWQIFQKNVDFSFWSNHALLYNIAQLWSNFHCTSTAFVPKVGNKIAP